MICRSRRGAATRRWEGCGRARRISPSDPADKPLATPAVTHGPSHARTPRCHTVPHDTAMTLTADADPGKWSPRPTISPAPQAGPVSSSCSSSPTGPRRHAPRQPRAAPARLVADATRGGMRTTRARRSRCRRGRDAIRIVTQPLSCWHHRTIPRGNSRCIHMGPP
jgi:hypothetical protein